MILLIYFLNLNSCWNNSLSSNSNAFTYSILFKWKEPKKEHLFPNEVENLKIQKDEIGISLKEILSLMFSQQEIEQNSSIGIRIVKSSLLILKRSNRSFTRKGIFDLVLNQNGKLTKKEIEYLITLLDIIKENYYHFNENGKYRYNNILNSFEYVDT